MKNKPDKFIVHIGLEVHVELKTLSKMFCACRNNPFDAIKPNIYTCPVCLGLPGALPVPNEKAVDWSILIGLALGCKVNKKSKFDRKHYFYPDLPKGYQISQYDQPISVNGELKIDSLSAQKGGKEIRITRVHLEEDTGKLIHAQVKGKEVSLIDFNRSGVPLVEIVSEPEIQSSQEAKDYVKKIQQLIRYLGVSDCDMEKGSMRLEANISVGKSNKLPNYKVEVKNLNSFRFLKEATDYEINRQTQLLKQGKTPAQETRGWHEDKKITTPQRSKEEAQDYRYFPEPDIPPMRFTSRKIRKIKDQLPELPDEKLTRFIEKLAIDQNSAKILAADKNTAEYFEKAYKHAKDQKVNIKDVVNAIVNKRYDIEKLTPAQLVSRIKSHKADQITDSGQLKAWVKVAIKNNPQAKTDFRKGKSQALGFFVGQVQKQAQGKADSQQVIKILKRELSR